MHMWSASRTTTTPRGARFCWSQSATCLVSRLLDLKVSCEELDDPREFGQAQDAFGGDVANVRDAMEWHEVVFAQRMERDVAGED
jgi:hypothetical protein